MQELWELLVDLGADGPRPILALVAGEPARDHIMRVHLMEREIYLLGHLRTLGRLCCQLTSLISMESHCVHQPGG